MTIDIEKITKFNVEIDKEANDAFDNVDTILMVLVEQMGERDCRTLTCFGYDNEPFNLDITDIEDFRDTLQILQKMFAIST